MGNQDRHRTTRKRTESWRFTRAIKRIRRARKLGTQMPPDRHYGRYGWLSFLISIHERNVLDN